MDSKPSQTTDTNNSVGISFSGGGIRALTFHLGVIKFLAEAGIWEQVKIVSSVSGGSLAVALVFALNKGRWPSSADFITMLDGPVRTTLTQFDLEREIYRRLLLKPWMIFRPRANVLADVLKAVWELQQNLQDFPDVPAIRINCTTYETGKNWRFSKERMGDYITGYIAKPSISIAQAVSASAAYPGLIGPLRMKTKTFEHEASSFGDQERKAQIAQKNVWLWDGGVYENLGVESLYKNRNLQKNLEFLLVSDASGQLGVETRRWSLSFPYFLAPYRLINIAMDQTRALRARDLLATFIEDRKKGRYIYIANSVPQIYERAKKEVPSEFQHLSDDEVRHCSHFPTNLKRLSVSDFNTLVRHGYEVTKATLDAYAPEEV